MTRDQVFISYGAKDGAWLQRLQTMLAPMARKGMSVWDVTKIRVGDLVRVELQEALDSAAVAVLLVSPDLLGSDVYEQQVLPLLAAARDDRLTIVWVPVRDSLYSETDLRDYAPAADASRPLAALSEAEAESVLATVCRTVGDALLERARRQGIVPSDPDETPDAEVPSTGTATSEPPPEPDREGTGGREPRTRVGGRRPMVTHGVFVALAVLPLVDLLVGIGPAWPPLSPVVTTAMAVVVLLFVFFSPAAGPLRLRRTLIVAAVGGGTYFLLSAGLHYDIPGGDRGARGFVLRDEVRTLISDTYTVDDALRGAEYDANKVYEPWSVVAARIWLLAAWVAVFACLAYGVARLAHPFTAAETRLSRKRVDVPAGEPPQ